MLRAFLFKKEVSEKQRWMKLFHVRRILIFHTESFKGDITIIIIQRPLLSITKVRHKRVINCVFIFYKAMVTFAQKHFSKTMPNITIHLAIYFRHFILNCFKFSFLSLLITQSYFSPYCLNQSLEK